MRIILSTSPHVRHPAVLQNDFEPDPSLTYTFAPVGLLSLLATLRTEWPQAEYSIYDFNRRIRSGELPLDGRLYGAVSDELAAGAPDVIGFMTECDSYHHVLQILKAAKSLLPACKMVLGGPHASAVAMATMLKAPFVDAVVIGEGERTFSELIASIGSGGPIPGALTRAPDGSILDGGPRALVDNLDDLPVPAYDLYLADPDEEIFLEVGRGCPFKCTFCSTAPYWHRKHRTKSPARVLREILLLKELYGTARVHFTHDLFTADRKWVRRVCAALIEADSPIAWTCSARTDTVDPELLELMAKAGCAAIYFGVESGSERILSEIQKAIPLEQSWSAVEACRDAGITPNAGFIVGFPSEDQRSFEATFSAYEQALRRGCKPAHVFAFCPFAQSSVYPSLKNLGCNGHFIDLPLGRETDLRNRALVAGDPQLFGGFFRPRLSGLVHEGIGAELLAIEGADEFSPLVEATLAPSLALAGLIGGMAKLYGRWIRWIANYNDERGAAPFRRLYGSPARFAEFLLDELSRQPGAHPAALAAARLLFTNLNLGEARSPTAIATYRSVALRDIEDVRLSDAIDASSIMGLLELGCDASPALQGSATLDYAATPTFFIWQQLERGDIRLLSVDEPIFRLIEEVLGGPVSVSDLIMKAGRGGGHEAPGGAMWARLGDALDAGLVSTGRES